MMADGNFERMGNYDAQQRRDVAGSSFKIGDFVSVIDPEEGSVSLTVGDEYCDNRTLTGKVRTGKLIGADFHVCWDNHKNFWIDCNRSLSEAYRVAIMLWDDGKTSPIGAQYLWGAWTDADKDKLPAPALHFLTYDEMVSLPDPQWLIDGLIMERTSALMFGKSNSYKSFLGIDMACSLATGTAWHGSEIAAPTPVLYVATEGALGVAKQRIPGWMEAHSVPHDLRQMITLYPQEIAVDDDKSITDLLQSCGIGNSHRKLARGEKVWNEKDPKGAFSLIVVDIFGASMNGPETSDETARAWVRNVNRIMREVDCAVLTIAHTGWADETRARMHTHFWGSFDTRLKAVGDKDSLTTVLTVDRHKDADSSGEWGFRLDVVDTPTGGTTLVPRLCDDVQHTQKRRVSGKPAVALQALSEALIEHGRTIAGPNYPSCPVASIEQWRVMCDRHGLTDSDNADTRRKTFNRAKATLIEKGLVKQFDDNIWKANAND